MAKPIKEPDDKEKFFTIFISASHDTQLMSSHETFVSVQFITDANNNILLWHNRRSDMRICWTDKFDDNIRNM